jgi:lipid II:glycine glycyltransferase (peptidoglycan interpeptide bridge formation enzyme)
VVAQSGRNKCQSSLQRTLITDLSASEEELWSEMSGTVKNEINKSKKEATVTQSYIGSEVTDELLKAFSEMYTELYEEKRIHGKTLNLEELKAYREKNALLVTTAAMNHEVVVYHSYITVEKNSRLLHSCSMFRIQDNRVRNAIGRANKFLHWNDWLLLKSRGVEEYDWGGISSCDKPNGIDRFKMAFGGTYREYYNVVCTCSMKAKLCDIIKKMRK